MSPLRTSSIVTRLPLRQGAEGLKNFWGLVPDSVPRLETRGRADSPEDDKVAFAYTVSGTIEGSFDGHEPTGKRMSVRGLQIARFGDSMMVERWGMSDVLRIHKQLGLVSRTSESRRHRSDCVYRGSPRGSTCEVNQRRGGPLVASPNAHRH